MEPTVRDTLRQLIVQHGRALCDEAPRCETMLRDLCGQHKPEIALLISALQQRVPAALLANAAGLSPLLLVDQLRERLAKELFLTAEAAHWAVETWALALGVIAEPAPAPAATPEPPPSFRDRLKDGSEGPEMVRLPAGRFLMGASERDTTAFADERPQHEVRIAHPFAIGRFPVTFEDYDRFVIATRPPPAAKRGLMGRLFGGEEHEPRELPGDEGWGRGRRPVINVSWHDAVAYCVWLSEQTGRTYRLPSEADWEYASRAGTATRWSFGDDENALGDHAWYKDNSGGKTHPIGEKRPNPWGLHDIHGNIWEWMQDCWHDNYAGAPVDDSEWHDNCLSADRVVRGGSWINNARNTRVSHRSSNEPDSRQKLLGLRLAQDL
ncbi:formylglycine-generating enzyme family protein [uncultured Thiodictyon sp.]|uniref:formylglycine-generating enzyme family protein n=1 Tax=uncultured Thiodictyon sp. TaxID=1846217 RepID=UPI0025D6F6C2|nr:formylglycine-generating enzyme family protein [uncultured Thiodictyon sp.]